MGLIKAAMGAAGGVLADQWKEYFYCDSLPDNVLLTKGSKRVSRRSSNRKASENIISNGSVVAVADGQCMMIVEQGKVVDFCAEPGEFIYNSDTEPTVFTGSLGRGLLDTFKNVGKRFTFGGEPPMDQRVYYVNTRELMGNKYGTPNPIIFRISDPESHLRLDMPIRCFGEYSYRIADPLLFYTKVTGNAQEDYTRDRLEGEMKSELLTHLQPAFARISAKGISYWELMGHTLEIRDALKDELSSLWGDSRGIEIVNFGVSSMKGDEKVEEKMRNIQLYRADPSSMAAEIGAAQAEAMRSAAQNEGAGPAMAFMGMNMAGQAGGANLQDLYETGMRQDQLRQQQAPAAPEGWTCSCGQSGNTGSFCSGCGKPKPVPVTQTPWTCTCGRTGNTGKFCMDCGRPRPAAGWTCVCGAVNKGRFCTECGRPKPAGVPQYKCDKCGWEPADPTKPPKFCPNCGDPFDDGDVK